MNALMGPAMASPAWAEAAAMRYQHAASGRDVAIAEAMSNVVKMKPRTA